MSAPSSDPSGIRLDGARLALVTATIVARLGLARDDMRLALVTASIVAGLGLARQGDELAAVERRGEADVSTARALGIEQVMRETALRHQGRCDRRSDNMLRDIHLYSPSGCNHVRSPRGIPATRYCEFMLQSLSYTETGSNKQRNN